jgi:hypothetical protein
MYSEWFNVDNTGNWSDLNSAWNSPLKLHAAGFIRYSYDNIGTPYLEYRNGGYGGYYYSSTQANEYDAWTLQGSNNSLNPYEMVQRDKTFGNSVRCLRD